MKILIHFLVLFPFLCTNTNAQWTEQSSGTTSYLWANSAVDNNVCWMGGDDGVVIRTTNGGANWISVGGGSIGTASVFNIFAWDSNFALCATTPNATRVYRTTDGGTTWTQVFTQTGGFIDNIWLTSETNGFMIGDPINLRWSIWKTSDGGITWDSTGLYLPAIAGEMGYINSLHVDGSNIYFGTSNSRAFYSSNGGTSWIAQPMPLTNSFCIWFNSSSFGFAAGPPEGLVATTNGGTSWLPVTMPILFGIVTSLTGFDNQLYGLEDDTDPLINASKIIGSTDYGNSWSTEYTAPSGFYTTQIAKARMGDVIWVGRSNGGITIGTNILPVEDEETVPAEFALEQNYPNPFNPSTTFRYSIPTQSKVVIKVFDILGNEIATLMDEEKSVGIYELTWNAENLSSGIYFYQLKAGEFTQTRKMILIK